MRRLIVFATVLLVSMGAIAGERKQLFGGYQYTNAGLGGSRVNVAKGWDADFEYKFSKEFGIVGDASGANKEGSKIHTFMAGPRFSMNGRKFTPFVEGLFGTAVLSSGGNNSAKMSMAFGGGLDYRVGWNLSVRVVKVDYNLVKIDGFTPLPGGSGWMTYMNNLRFATGFVVKF